ncbi:MAG: type VI secretion system protein ImpK [Paraglaciecola sp.]|jgi:type VI secretion system protein ImpK
MSNDDLDRTLIIPSPGRRRGSPPGVAETPPQPSPGQPPRQTAPVNDSDGLSMQMIGSSGQNPLLNAATMAFSLASQLRNTPAHSDVEGLLAHVTGLLRDFEKNCMLKGVNGDQANEARYILCAFIDEIVLNTPWGNRSVWTQRSLLSTLHNDTSGGERFFQILAQKSEVPAQNILILELMYHCLCLGFQGKFAVQDNGQAALQQIKNGLYQIIREFRGDPEQELSLHWQGVSDGRPTLAKLIPWWVVGAVLSGVLTLIYAGFFFTLNDQSDDAFSKIGKLGREIPQMVETREVGTPLVDPGLSSVDLVKLAEQLNDYLRNEIASHQVTLSRQNYGLKITIHNTGLFSSASASVSNTHYEMLNKIATTLSVLPGPIVVSGHSDSQKIQTLRYPSNWHLSDARARAVVELLVAGGMDQDKLVVQGKADTMPVATNETPEGRKQNRRIEIFVRSY